jgi:hypothetical protein
MGEHMALEWLRRCARKGDREIDQVVRTISAKVAVSTMPSAVHGEGWASPYPLPCPVYDPELTASDRNLMLVGRVDCQHALPVIVIHIPNTVRPELHLEPPNPDCSLRIFVA